MKNFQKIKRLTVFLIILISLTIDLQLNYPAYFNVYAEETISENSIYAVSEDIVSVPAEYLKSCQYKGTIEEITVSENTISENDVEIIEERYIYVYLPYGYDETKQYDIVYHQCGLKSTTNELMAGTSFANILDNLIAKGNIEPVIFVVIPDMAYGQTKSFKKHMLEIMELVESNYSTYACFDISEESLIASSSHRLIGGFSQGAFATWDIMAKNNKYADYYAPISPFYAKNWNYEYQIIKASKASNRIRVFNTIGECECEPNYRFDGIEQLYALQSVMEDNGIENRSYIIKDADHSQFNCMTAYYYALIEYFPAEK